MSQRFPGLEPCKSRDQILEEFSGCFLLIASLLLLCNKSPLHPLPQKLHCLPMPSTKSEPSRSPIFSAIQTNLANLLGSLPTWIPSLTNSVFPRTWTTSSISNHRNHYWTKCWRSMYCLNCLKTRTKTSSEVLNWTMNLRHPQLHETGGLQSIELSELTWILSKESLESRASCRMVFYQVAPCPFWDTSIEAEQHGNNYSNSLLSLARLHSKPTKLAPNVATRTFKLTQNPQLQCFLNPRCFGLSPWSLSFQLLLRHRLLIIAVEIAPIPFSHLHRRLNGLHGNIHKVCRRNKIHFVLAWYNTWQARWHSEGTLTFPFNPLYRSRV